MDENTSISLKNTKIIEGSVLPTKRKKRRATERSERGICI